MLTVIHEILAYKIGNSIFAWPLGLGGIAGFFILSRTIGTRNAASALIAYSIAVFMLLSVRKARQNGWEDRKQKEIRDVRDFQEKLAQARADAERTVSAGRLSDDDGYKRK